MPIIYAVFDDDNNWVGWIMALDEHGPATFLYGEVVHIAKFPALLSSSKQAGFHVEKAFEGGCSEDENCFWVRASKFCMVLGENYDIDAKLVPEQFKLDGSRGSDTPN